MRPCLIPLLCLSLLSACAPFVKSQITVFHEIPPTLAGTTYVMIPLQEQEGSLEHKSYASAVKSELDARGFRESSWDEAELVVVMFYGIDTGKQVIASYPIIGQTGVSSSYTSGTIQSYGGYGTYSGTTTYTPSYGIVGTGVASRTEYTRFFKLDMLDKKALEENQLKKIYEARVLSRGRGAEISAVLPTMIKSLFEDFPGKSGGMRNSTRIP